MQHAPLAAWESFYVIVGSSSAALTGLVFVVITLGAERTRTASRLAVDSFGTPTVVHFSAAFLLSAICSAPWETFAGPARLIALIGVAGVIYGFIVIRRTNRQTDYQPVFEDWMWHVVFPMTSYTLLLVASIALMNAHEWSLYAIATASVLLVVDGIHNAWDAVTYRVMQLSGAPSVDEPADNVPADSSDIPGQ